MPQYEYQVVPFPGQGIPGQGTGQQRAGEVSRQLQRVVNENAEQE